jgi:hypothetical protein
MVYQSPASEQYVSSTVDDDTVYLCAAFANGRGLAHVFSVNIASKAVTEIGNVTGCNHLQRSGTDLYWMEGDHWNAASGVVKHAKVK